MKLHHNPQLFSEIILRASLPCEKGGLGINPLFIEKDYWITNALYHLANSQWCPIAVFKGGTSLSKIYGIGARFSEDIDIAVIHLPNESDSHLKTTIRAVANTMAQDLQEVDHPGATSKGSRYRKVYYSYPQSSQIFPSDGVVQRQLLLEINSFANPYPYALHKVESFIYSYLVQNRFNDIIEEYEISPCNVNVLDKRTTLTEKAVSLMRFSLSPRPAIDLQAKIRHFYDLHYLLSDSDCQQYITSEKFRNDFSSLLEHDRAIFSTPSGWQMRSISESALITEWSSLWSTLSKRYSTELPSLAYSTNVPPADSVAESVLSLLQIINNL